MWVLLGATEYGDPLNAPTPIPVAAPAGYKGARGKLLMPDTHMHLVWATLPQGVWRLCRPTLTPSDRNRKEAGR